MLCYGTVGDSSSIGMTDTNAFILADTRERETNQHSQLGRPTPTRTFVPTDMGRQRERRERDRKTESEKGERACVYGSSFRRRARA
mmetsp:Transcript_38478/g.96398  ORF Transcript_38478/g.96398 Transcript_38478/m.96398 type:complete len:86 (+) Transcript_38478:1466-1723(+)